LLLFSTRDYVLGHRYGGTCSLTERKPDQLALQGSVTPSKCLQITLSERTECESVSRKPGRITGAEDQRNYLAARYREPVDLATPGLLPVALSDGPGAL